MFIALGLIQPLGAVWRSGNATKSCIPILNSAPPNRAEGFGSPGYKHWTPIGVRSAKPHRSFPHSKRLQETLKLVGDVRPKTEVQF
jgi:hypothetical protein